MKKAAVLLVVLSVALGSSSFADDPAPFELKNKSSFKMVGDRNPFWPIGSKFSQQTRGSESPASDIPSSYFVVSSITIEQGARFAIINGKIIQEGQQFALQMGGSTYQLTLKVIEDGRVVLGRRDQEIIVPLRRK